MGFSRFWEAEVVIFGNFGNPGTPFRGPGPHFDDFLIFRDFGSAPPRKGSPILRQKLSHNPLLGVVDFGGFFEVFLLSVFLDFGRPEAPF